MFLKAGVSIAGIRPELMIGVNVFQELFHTLLSHEMTITSVVDGKHSHTSLHYNGSAFDIRTRDLNDGEAEKIVKEAKKRLTRDFDILLESDHIHVEYQPRRRAI